MWWVLAAAILVFLAFKFRSFGKVLIGAITIIVAIYAVVYFIHQSEEEASKKRISPQEIELVDLELRPNYSGYKMTGRIKNKSTTCILTSLRVKNVIRDVLPNNQSEIVGETVTWIYHNVPPMQTRGIDESVYFSSMPKPIGKYEWEHEIIEIKGVLLK